MQFLINWLVSALAILITAYILPGVVLAGFGTALVVAIVLGLINAFIRPIVVFLTLPINILTLGLFTFVINALMIMIVSGLIDGFAVRNFWWALLFSLIVSLVSALLHGVLEKD